LQGKKILGEKEDSLCGNTDQERPVEKIANRRSSSCFPISCEPSPGKPLSDQKASRGENQVRTSRKITWNQIVIRDQARNRITQEPAIEKPATRPTGYKGSYLEGWELIVFSAGGAAVDLQTNLKRTRGRGSPTEYSRPKVGMVRNRGGQIRYEGERGGAFHQKKQNRVWSTQMGRRGGDPEPGSAPE